MSTKTLIIYQSRAGTTEKAAKILAEKLDGDTMVINLKKDKNPSLDDYPTVIIGGSIRASMIQSGIKKFIGNNMDILKTKDIGLFLCCMEEGETAEKQFNESYPEELRNMAKAKGLFGGEFDFDRLNFLEKGIIKKVAGVTGSVYNINYEAIDAFAKKFNP
jgi:menaquinone-dependent protoporphyrinogen oxidase